MRKHPPINIDVKRVKKGDKVHYEAKLAFVSNLTLDSKAEKSDKATEYEMRGEIARNLSISILKFASNYRNDGFTMTLDIGKPSLKERFKKLFSRSK